MPKQTFKNIVQEKITTFWEEELKQSAMTSENLKYFNVEDLKLNGSPHPAVNGANTTTQAKELRPAIKMLLNDYYSYEFRPINSNNVLSPYCRLPGCKDQIENVHHVLNCPATASVRAPLLQDLRELVTNSCSNVNFDAVSQDKECLVQFLLDCSSANLATGRRVDLKDPHLLQIYTVCRKVINVTHCERIKLLRDIKDSHCN